MHFDTQAVTSFLFFLNPYLMQPTQSIYPAFKLKNTSFFTQQLPGNNPTPCKPVAIISHDTEVKLITCSKSVAIQGTQTSCHHHEYESHSTLPLAELIKDLQQKGCSVYAQNSVDGTLTDHFPELSHSDLVEMDTSDTALNASPQDLDAHPVNENTLLQLLPPETVTPLIFSQQETSANAPQQPALPSSSSATFLNLPGSIADTRNTQGALTHTAESQNDTTANAATSSPQPSTSAIPSTSAADRETLNLTLEALPPHESRKIYCILSVLHSASAPLSRHDCINAMKAKYADFRAIRATSAYGSSFATAVKLGLIEKIGNVSSLGGITYRILPAGAQFITND